MSDQSPKTDYTGNSHKSKQAAAKPVKQIKKVVVGEVVVKKKPFGRKVKDLIVEADFGSVSRYIFMDVLIPAAKNLVVDATTKGIERMIYGDRISRYRSGGQPQRVSYNNPIARSYTYSDVTRAVSPPQDPRLQSVTRMARPSGESFILASREDAEAVLQQMTDIVDQYQVASVGDLNSLVGRPPGPLDEKWGWMDMRDVQIMQVREGYLIDFPVPTPI